MPTHTLPEPARAPVRTLGPPADLASEAPELPCADDEERQGREQDQDRSQDNPQDEEDDAEQDADDAGERAEDGHMYEDAPTGLA
jgi:hypothetical protein